MKYIRTIQRAKAAYFCYLPVKWIKKMKLFKGSYLLIQTKSDGSITIKPIELKGEDGNIANIANTD